MVVAHAMPEPVAEPVRRGFWRTVDKVAGFIVNLTVFGIGLFSPFLAYAWTIIDKSNF
ncbi:MAG: hypothetical protein VW268_11285 [Rhodospirillaceae bacterium]